MFAVFSILIYNFAEGNKIINLNKKRQTLMKRIFYIMLAMTTVLSACSSNKKNVEKQVEQVAEEKSQTDSGKNAGARKNSKNVTERGKNGSGSNAAGTVHKKKTIRNVHKKKR